MPINNFVLTTEPLGTEAAERLIRERRFQAGCRHQEDLEIAGHGHERNPGSALATPSGPAA